MPAANPFDQFDGPTSGAASNPFDQFDGGPAPKPANDLGKQALDFGRALLSIPATTARNFADDYHARQQAAIDTLRQAQEDQRADPAKGPLEIAGGQAMAALEGAGGVFSYPASPVTAAVDTVVGRPLETLTKNAPEALRLPRTLPGDITAMVAPFAGEIPKVRAIGKPIVPADVAYDRAPNAFAPDRPATAGPVTPRPATPNAFDRFDQATASAGQVPDATNTVPPPPTGGTNPFDHFDPPPAAASPPPMDFSTLVGRVEARESHGHQFDAHGQPLTSSKGAFGAMQLEPGTAADMARRVGHPDWAEAAKTDPDINRLLGREYLSQLHRQFGDETAAVAAYNAGPGVVKDWIEGTNHSGKNASLTRLGEPRAVGSAAWTAGIPFHETRACVASILGDHGEAGSPGSLPQPAPIGQFQRPGQEAPGGPIPPIPVAKAANVFDHFDTSDTPPAAPPTPIGTPRDLTDQALDVLRSGGKVRNDQGPSLLDFVAKNGGLKDDGGELANMDAHKWHLDLPFRPRLIRDTGSGLEAMAERAQEAGYLPERWGDADTRPSSQGLLDAIRQELAGKPTYARASDNADLRAHVADSRGN